MRIANRISRTVNYRPMVAQFFAELGGAVAKFLPEFT